jgi:hypothetical protein
LIDLYTIIIVFKKVFHVKDLSVSFQRLMSLFFCLNAYDIKAKRIKLSSRENILFVISIYKRSERNGVRGLDLNVLINIAKSY